MIHLISYGDKFYSKAKIRFKKQADDFGFKKVTIFGPENIDKEFYNKHRQILQTPRGGGFWFWKPYFIKQELDKLNNNDILIYLDVGCTINRFGRERFYEYIDMIEKSEYGLIGFQMKHTEYKYTKRKIFDYLNVDPYAEIGKSGQILGGLQIIRKCPHSCKIVNEWFQACEDDDTLFNDKKSNEIPEFRDNRHDQSIQSVIKKKYGCVLIPDETFYRDWNDGIDFPFLATRLRK